VDTSGPLTVRIEGPQEVTAIDAPLPVTVVLENAGDKPVQGTLALRLIDRWCWEPKGPVPFEAPSKGSRSYKFEVTAGDGTYSAHYPIHAFARFEYDGRPHVAHPILVLETKLPERQRPTPSIAWKPLTVPPDSRLALADVSVHRVVVQVFGQGPQTLPAGWQGSEPTTRAGLGVHPQTLAGQSRRTLFMHPPWWEGRAGTILAEYPLTLPKTTPIKLRFANAVTPEGKSDGVTFRVRALPLDAPDGELGKVVFERHSAAKTWQDAEADLSEFAGQNVRLQIESHPGPDKNTGWDHSFWAEPVLVAGNPPSPPPFPPKDDAGSRLLGTLRRGGRNYDVRLWPGRRGLLDAVVALAEGDRRICFRGFEVRVHGAWIDDPQSPTRLVRTETELIDGGCRTRHWFSDPSGVEFQVVGTLQVERDVLRARFALETDAPQQPWRAVYLEDVAAGTWSEPVRQVYAGAGNVVRNPGPFTLQFEGHRLSTSMVGFDFAGGMSLVQSSDVPPEALEVRPGERHYSLHVPHDSQITFIPAENVWQGVAAYRETNGLKPAGGVAKLAGRFVFDLWGGRYGESRDALRRAFRYGLTDAAVVWHNWQRWGYDYRLPEIYPPNPDMGAEQELKEMIDVCREAAVPFALHDNYIDYYPDAEGFSYETEIAFHQDGRPVRAWLNEWRKAQSYRYRADRVEGPLRGNLRLIRENVPPTAYFIDVWSSIHPYDYWTADGRFFNRVFTRDTWGRQFSWIREFLGDDAPQISESGHDQLIGHLDGAQTNHLRVGKRLPEAGYYQWCIWNWECDDAERTPWFDAAHHDRFILHGAGYSERYQGGLNRRLHGIYSDDYIATEVLTGHPAMVPEPFGRDVVRKYWLLADLMRALALRRIEKVEYVGDDLHRQRVAWSGNGQVSVNRGENDWTVEGHVLPPYGFFARAPTEQGTVEAAIERRDGAIVEWARSPSRLYVNGRQVVDEAWPIRMTVGNARVPGGRDLEMSLSWQVDRPVPEGYRPFLHFVDAAGEILFQAGQDPSAFAEGKTGAIASVVHGHVPDGLPLAEPVELRMGFYRPADGHRLSLAGEDDGERRIRIGTIRLKEKDKRIAAVDYQRRPASPDPWLLRQNPEAKPIDFGGVTTAGGCRLAVDGGALVVTPLPAALGPKCGVRIEPARLPWRLPRLAHVEAIGEDGRSAGRRPAVRDGDAIVVTCEPGVFAYRVTTD
jgi:hypothetical protein